MTAFVIDVLLGGLAESEPMQELVNEQDLSALRLHRELEELKAAHVNHPASRLGERRDDPVGATLSRVITLDEVEPREEVRGRRCGGREVHRQRAAASIGELVE